MFGSATCVSRYVSRVEAFAHRTASGPVPTRVPLSPVVCLVSLSGISVSLSGISASVLSCRYWMCWSRGPFRAACTGCHVRRTAKPRAEAHWMNARPAGTQWRAANWWKRRRVVARLRSHSSASLSLSLSEENCTAKIVKLLVSMRPCTSAGALPGGISGHLALKPSLVFVLPSFWSPQSIDHRGHAERDPLRWSSWWAVRERLCAPSPMRDR